MREERHGLGRLVERHGTRPAVDSRPVYILARKALTQNTRIFKQARTLTRAGYDVTVIGILPRDGAPREERDGYTILRLPVVPLQVRGRRALRQWSRTCERRLRPSARVIRRVTRDTGGRLGDVRSRVLARGRALEQAASAIPGPSGCEPAGILRFVMPPAAASRAAIKLRLTDRLVNELRRLAWPLRSWEYYRLAHRLVAHELPRPVVLQANDLDTMLVATVLARRLRVPLIYDAQELYTGIHTLPDWYRRVLAVQEAILIRAADRVIAVNPLIAGEMERRYRRHIDSVVLNCPPYEEISEDAARATIRERFYVPDEVPIFLFSGGLRPDRGIEKTILALRSLETGVLVILGEGPLREDLEQLVNDHGVKSRVFFTDFVAHDEVPSLIRSADVGVIPYEHVGTNHYLASPSKLFHYVMAELPIACSDFPFLRAVVVEHELGDVFDPGDPASIAGTLGAMVDDPRRYARYKANLARLKRRYSWEEEEKRFMENYRAVDPGVADERRA